MASPCCMTSHLFNRKRGVWVGGLAFSLLRPFKTHLSLDRIPDSGDPAVVGRGTPALVLIVCLWTSLADPHVCSCFHTTGWRGVGEHCNTTDVPGGAGPQDQSRGERARAMGPPTPVPQTRQRALKPLRPEQITAQTITPETHHPIRTTGPEQEQLGEAGDAPPACSAQVVWRGEGTGIWECVC